MARQVFQIPLVNIPQKFAITLAQVQYILTCKWNAMGNTGWILDIDDGQTELPIIHAIPLVTGADLLEQFSYLGFTGKLFVYTDGDAFSVPTLENLGAESNLYFVVEDDT